MNQNQTEAIEALLAGDEATPPNSNSLRSAAAKALAMAERDGIHLSPSQRKALAIQSESPAYWREADGRNVRALKNAFSIVLTGSVFA